MVNLLHVVKRTNTSLITLTSSHQLSWRFLFLLLPPCDTRNSDPGLLSRLLFPLPTPTHAYIFIARKFHSALYSLVDSHRTLNKWRPKRDINPALRRELYAFYAKTYLYPSPPTCVNAHGYRLAHRPLFEGHSRRKLEAEVRRVGHEPRQRPVHRLAQQNKIMGGGEGGGQARIKPFKVSRETVFCWFLEML